MKIVITGADGFVGRNLVSRLKCIEMLEVNTITRGDGEGSIQEKLAGTDILFHLAGVNRTENENDFQSINAEFTKHIVEQLESQERPYTLIYTSSTQAILDNAYGKSKLAAENILRTLVKRGQCLIFRLPGIFGKWCKPNYNSVVATFCHNVANGAPIYIRDEGFEVTLVYIDDVVEAFMPYLLMPSYKQGTEFLEVKRTYKVTLGTIAGKLRSFKESRSNLFLPNVGDDFDKALYSTYLSYLPTSEFAYPLELKSDQRGSLFELFKTANAGQVFLSTTFPGITRGNHFHHTKTEKFLVIQGKGVIRFRKTESEEIIEYTVNGEKPVVVDIPPGYTHNITNTGSDIMITLFWANEIFDSNRPDTYFLQV